MLTILKGLEYETVNPGQDAPDEDVAHVESEAPVQRKSSEDMV